MKFPWTLMTGVTKINHPGGIAEWDFAVDFKNLTFTSNDRNGPGKVDGRFEFVYDGDRRILALKATENDFGQHTLAWYLVDTNTNTFSGFSFNAQQSYGTVNGRLA